MAMKDYMRQEIFEIVLYLFIGVFFALLLPLIAGFSFQGFSGSFESGQIAISDYLGQFTIYLFLIVASLFLIIFPISSLLFIKKDETPETQPNPRWWRIFTVSWIFNVERSGLYLLSEAMGFKGNRNFMNFSKNLLRVIVFSILIFGTLGLIQVANPQFNVVGTPQGAVSLQVTEFSNAIFGAVLPAFGENGVLSFFLFLLMGIVAYFTAKFMRDRNTQKLTFFLVGLLVVSPLVSLGFSSFHLIVYGSSDVTLIATFIFAYLVCAITMLTGQWIIGFIWHIMNNLFINLARSIEATEDIFFITIIILAVIAMIWGGVEFYLWGRKRKKKKDN